MIYWELMLSFLKIGLFSFGGGYGSLPLIRDEVVRVREWLSPEAFSDLITISQMTPGPIAINAATFVGLQMGGLGGAIVATLSNVTPCVIIVILLAKLYEKYADLPLMQAVLQGLRPAVAALISSAAVSLTLEALAGTGGLADLAGMNLFSLALFVLSLLLYYKAKRLDPIVIMLMMGVLGGVAFYLFHF